VFDLGIPKFICFFFFLVSFYNIISLKPYQPHFCSPPPPLPPFLDSFPLFFLLTFLLLQTQVSPRWVCRPPFLLCLFPRLMRLLDWIVQSSIYVSLPDPPQNTLLHCAYRPHPLPTTPTAFDSDKPTTDRDSHALAHGFFVL
jgi:hypothetical protein